MMLLPYDIKQTPLDLAHHICLFVFVVLRYTALHLFVCLHLQDTVHLYLHLSAVLSYITFIIVLCLYCMRHFSFRRLIADCLHRIILQILFTLYVFLHLVMLYVCHSSTMGAATSICCCVFNAWTSRS